MKSEDHNNRGVLDECRFCTPLLNEYVDGRLNADTTWRLKNHVSVCGMCSSTVQSLNSVSRLLGEAPRYQVSEAFAAALVARIAATPRRQPLSSRLFGGARVGIFVSRVPSLRWTAPFAAAAACVVFATLMFVRPINVPVASSPAAPITSPQTDMPDSAVVQTCLNQHRSLTTSDPLTDTSAQLLTASVDNLPVDTSKSQDLSDDDAKVLLGEEM